jgi:hypothetical protein
MMLFITTAVKTSNPTYKTLVIPVISEIRKIAKYGRNARGLTVYVRDYISK